MVDDDVFEERWQKDLQVRIAPSRVRSVRHNGYIDISTCNNGYQWSSFCIHESQLAFLRDILSNYIAQRKPITCLWKEYDPARHDFRHMINVEAAVKSPKRIRTVIRTRK